ncbi:MAG: hybrid sensor histidine kinase/response regulator [Desulfurivibrio sp.]|nr:MAG: hybrid sensor histidine kinase/response regulator [Desulfurivibrio sp.]
MPLIEDDETLLAFVEESKEHLDGIEADLLAIEEAGANIDVDRVNKVFRAVHSLKGGAGFLGLDKVKDLAHAAENLMNLIRNGELTPTPVIVSTLLDATDLLSTMINHAAGSNEVDISAHLAALQRAVAANLDEEVKPTLDHAIVLGSPAVPDLFHISEFELNTASKGGNNLFILEYDLIADIEQQGKTPLAVIRELQQTGQLLDSRVDIASVGDLSADFESMRIPFFALFATIMEIDLLTGFLGLDPAKIHPLSLDEILSSAGQGAAGRAAPPAPAVRPEPAVAALAVAAPAAAPLPQPEPEPVRTGRMAEMIGQESAGRPATVKAASSSSSEAAQIKADTSLRVSVKILDNLMTLAGELVLTRNQLVQAVASRNQQGVDTVSQRLDLVTSELQEAIMSTRMQPIGNIFNKFKRVVRDLSKDLGKEVNLIIEGEEVELDKTIIEAIGDPLTHLVRNSVDHGIEVPAVRLGSGKPETGLLRLSAFHEGGQVIIEIEDDGAGINTDNLKAKVLEMGLYDRLHLESMSAKELNKLIFTPGLSTAREVTDVSGRGVGMDVVHTNLSRLGGVIDIKSSLGLGTTITIKLPLTLAIIPSLIVTCQLERFAIPQVNLVELVRVPAAQIKERIEKIGDALVIRLRGELLPLVHLRDALDIKDPVYVDPASREIKDERRVNISDPRGNGKNRAPAAGTENEEQQSEFIEKREGGDRRVNPLSAYNILVLASGDFHYGLIVDQLLDSEEIVVKPLGSHLRNCKCYAGATIQGDGKVALILDVVGISTKMKLNMVADKVKTQMQQTKDVKTGLEDSQSLLIVRNAPDEQMAIPLGLVSRIERIKTAEIKVTAGRRNIKYRGGSLALFGVDEVASVGMRDPDAQSCYVVVFPMAGREVGIMVSQIVDILDAKLRIDDVTHRQPGILGSMLIFDEITLLVDLYGVVAGVMPEWALIKAQSESSDDNKFNILIVEDSRFFMNQLENFVSEAGYRAFTAEDGVEALKVLGEEKIHLVLTDIEMPNMDGLELTRNIRRDSRWSSLPVIAVTSVAGEAAEQSGRQAGVDEYLIKLDREQIIEKIHHYLQNRK